MRTFKTEGIVIKRTNFSEADKFLTVFTKDLGKITIKAKGIRRVPSRRSPHVELLNHSVFSLYKGNSHPVLVEAETMYSFTNLKSDLHKTGLAYHICELIDGLCPEGDENFIVFSLLCNILRRLDSSSKDIIGERQDIVFAIHEFEVELLSVLGYWNNESKNSIKNDIHGVIEGIMEKRLRSKQIFSKI